MKTLVIVPTYNEKENIKLLLDEVLQVNPEVHILVVDDNSPDGTAGIVKTYRESSSAVNILERPGKAGLGKAYLAGFRWGLDAGYDVLVEMDADFSHRPIDLKSHLKKIKEHDVVIGSRWVNGGGTVNWGLGRKIISRGGSLYSRLILGYPIRDWTGGFNIWRRHVLEAIGLDEVKSEGYSFQIELKFRALKRGFKIFENPILFEDRRVGQSKMSSKIVLEALFRVWSIRWIT